MRRRLRRIPQTIEETDNLILLLIGMAIGLAFTILIYPVLIPRVAPFLQAGVTCNDLAAPRGGNARSMLAIAGNDPQNLELNIYLPRTALAFGDPLKLDVLFTNQDAGPIIFFMPELSDLTQNSQASMGVTVQIRNIATGQSPTIFRILTDPPAGIPFSTAEIHLLRSHDTCKQSYELYLS